MKVKDILKHSNAVNTTIITTNDPFTVLCEIDYLQKVSAKDSAIVNAHKVYRSSYHVPQEIKNKTVDFISAEDVLKLKIYVK